jgi:fatty-acid peroxygenase
MATAEIMKVAIQFLSNEMRYEVPRQNLRVSMMRIPSLPRSGFVMRNVRAVPQPEAAPGAAAEAALR